MNLTDRPAGWSIRTVDVSDGGTYRPTSSEVAWVGAPAAGSHVNATMTLSVPSDANAGDYIVSTDALDADGEVASSTDATVTVLPEMPGLAIETGSIAVRNSTATIEFTVVNTADVPLDSVALEVLIPFVDNSSSSAGSWPTVDQTCEGGTWNHGDPTCLWFVFPANSEGTLSITTAVPEQTTPGDHSVTGSVLLDDGRSVSRTATMEVVESCLPMQRAIVGSNDEIDTVEILQAIHYWSHNERVRGACSGTLSTTGLLELIDLWRANDPV